MSLTCIYCGKAFEPDEFVFAQYDETVSVHDSKYGDQDNMFAGGEAAIEPRKYRYYTVKDAVDDGVRYVKSDDGQSIPERITVYENDGILPDGTQPRTQQIQRFAESTGSFADEDQIDVGYTAADTVKQDQGRLIQVYRRLCPHCHFALPREYGVYKMHQIMMVGARSAGKTTYLINLAQRLDTMLASDGLGTIEIAEESKRYYQKLEKTYVETNGNSLRTDMKPICPLLFRYVDVAGKRSCFVAMYDVAGEAFQDDPRSEAYIMNHIGIQKSDAMMMIIDPGQISEVYQEKDESTERPNFNNFLNVSFPRIAGAMQNVRDAVIVITKFDLILMKQDMGHRFDPHCELLSGRVDSHRGGVSMRVMRNVHKSIENFISTWPGYEGKSLSTMVNQHFQMATGKQLHSCSLFGTSNWTITFDKGRILSVENQYTNTGLKYRINEPILNLMAVWGVVPQKKEVDQVEPKKKWWQIFGKN